MKRQVRLTSKDFERITESVRQAELKTSGEIVPVVVPSSAAYSQAMGLSAFFGFLAASLCWVLFHAWHLRTHWESHPWTQNPSWMLWMQGLGMVTGAALSFFPPWRRLLLPRHLLQRSVSSKAKELFVDLGLARTRDRTGVLVLVSLFERRVEILADEGIHQQVAEGFWAEEVQTLVKSIHEGQFTEGLCRVILDIGEKLAARFPRRADDINELPDAPVEGS